MKLKLKSDLNWWRGGNDSFRVSLCNEGVQRWMRNLFGAKIDKSEPLTIEIVPDPDGRFEFRAQRSDYDNTRFRLKVYDRDNRCFIPVVLSPSHPNPKYHTGPFSIEVEAVWEDKQ